MTHQNVNRVIVNYSEIGRSWKYDGSQSNQENMFEVTKCRFRKDRGYELRIGKSVICKHKLSSIEDLEIKKE